MFTQDFYEFKCVKIMNSYGRFLAKKPLLIICLELV